MSGPSSGMHRCLNPCLSPSPTTSLKFRTAGFPRYGFKAGISDGACRVIPMDVTPAPGTHHRAARLPPSFASSSGGAVDDGEPSGLLDRRCRSCPCASGIPHHPSGNVPYPRGPRSGPLMLCGPSSLIDPICPTGGHSKTSPLSGLYPLSLVEQERHDGPPLVPHFHHSSRADMPSSTTPGAHRRDFPVRRR